MRGESPRDGSFSNSPDAFRRRSLARSSRMSIMSPGRKERRLSLEEALNIGCEVCQALEHAHGQGIIHRDLKPGNIWLTSEGSASRGAFVLPISLDPTRITEEWSIVVTAVY